MLLGSVILNRTFMFLQGKKLFKYKLDFYSLSVLVEVIVAA